MLDLSSVELKLVRADEQFQDLFTEVAAFGERQPYRLAHRHSPDLKEHTLHIEFNERPPLARWGAMFGEGVQSLRSALDHLIYAIAIHESGQNPPPGAAVLMFPIADPPRRPDMRRLATLSPAVQAAVEALQPEMLCPQDSALWNLNKINQVDKHRLVSVSTARTARAEIPVSGLIPGSECTANWRLTGLEEDDPFLTITCDRPSPDVEFAIDMAMFVGLNPLAWGGDPALAPEVTGFAGWLRAGALAGIDQVVAAVQ